MKWVGGKRSLLLEILARIPSKFHTYYEPFVGGGAVFFALASKAEKAVLSDINFELAISYRAIQKDPHGLIKLLKYHELRHSKPYFYTIRDYSPTDPLRLSARFMYLNKTCYNGLYRRD